MATVLTCSNLFDGRSFVGPSRVVIEDGITVAIEPTRGPGDFPILSPGYVDIQMNGFEDVDVATMDASTSRRLGDRLATLGTTAWLGTVVTAPLEKLTGILDRLHSLIGTGGVTGCAGIHVEGPFLGGAPGAHNRAWIVPFDAAWASALPSSVRLITLAPEQLGSAADVSFLRDRAIAVSLGHTTSAKKSFVEAVENGAGLVTHLFNGMSGVHHRDDGVALFALTDDRVTAGLIADLVHVRAEAISLAFRAKGPERVCLVSDSVAWSADRATVRGVQVVKGAPRLPDGTIAGSCTPLAECVRNVVRHCGVATGDALRSATSTPANAAGLDGHGVIQLGSPSDIIALDDALHVLHTWRRLPFERDLQTDS